MDSRLLPSISLAGGACRKGLDERGQDGERRGYSDSVGRDAAGFPGSSLRSGRGAELWLGRSKKAHRKHRQPEEIEMAG